MRARVDQLSKAFLSTDVDAWYNKRRLLWWKESLESHYRNKLELGTDWKIAKDIYKIASKVLKDNSIATKQSLEHHSKKNS